MEGSTTHWVVVVFLVRWPGVGVLGCVMKHGVAGNDGVGGGSDPPGQGPLGVFQHEVWSEKRGWCPLLRMVLFTANL